MLRTYVVHNISPSCSIILCKRFTNVICHCMQTDKEYKIFAEYWNCLSDHALLSIACCTLHHLSQSLLCLCVYCFVPALCYICVCACHWKARCIMHMNLSTVKMHVRGLISKVSERVPQRHRFIQHLLIMFYTLNGVLCFYECTELVILNRRVFTIIFEHKPNTPQSGFSCTGSTQWYRLLATI